MAYTCPRCGDSIQRGYSGSAQVTAGLVGALFYAAFGAFECKKCGKISHSEFSPEVRVRITVGSLALIATAAMIAVGVIWLCSNT
jgi:hypothetical protein